MNHSTVLVVEDDAALREALCDTLDIAGFSVTVAENGRQALDAISSQEIGMVISDVQMKPMDGHTLLRQIKTNKPDIPVLLMTAYGTIQKAVEAIQNGAADYLVKPFEANVLIEMVSRYISLEPVVDGGLVSVDEKSQEVLALADRVAGSDITVMITGESGTGKEVLARYIHRHSKRAGHPFVAINCAAIPDNMLEAMLFGYEKGAFTGAYQSSPGKFEQAQGGTLLLDEISEMDLGLQAKLLRVLQEREVERLGGRNLVKLDVRVFATSNRKMREEVDAGRFREDLFYRLNVFPMHIPPLRERPLDILPIAERLLTRGAQSYGRQLVDLSEDAKQKLLNHSWPGNVRELDNVVQRALILQSGNQICAQDLQLETPGQSQMTIAPVAVQKVQDGENLSDDLRSREQALIAETLRSMRGNRKATAEKLGISQRTLRYKLARMREDGVAIPGSLSAEGI